MWRTPARSRRAYLAVEKRAALILNVPRRVGHSKSAIISAASLVYRQPMQLWMSENRQTRKRRGRRLAAA